MVEMLLRSCYKGANEHEPKSEIWVRMEDWGEMYVFPFFGVKVPKWP